MSREVCDHLRPTDQPCEECEHEANHGWIKVGDRLPDPWGRVLIWVPDEGGHLCATFTQGKFFHGGHQERPTHWQPLPEAPIH